MIQENVSRCGILLHCFTTAVLCCRIYFNWNDSNEIIVSNSSAGGIFLHLQPLSFKMQYHQGKTWHVLIHSEQPLHIIQSLVIWTAYLMVMFFICIFILVVKCTISLQNDLVHILQPGTCGEIIRGVLTSCCHNYYLKKYRKTEKIMYIPPLINQWQLLFFIFISKEG